MTLSIDFKNEKDFEIANTLINGFSKNADSFLLNISISVNSDSEVNDILWPIELENIPFEKSVY